MNPVEWLQSVLPAGPFVISGWVIVLAVITWLIAIALIMSLMMVASKDRRRADYYHSLVVGEINRVMQQANSPGPQVTKKTLMDESRE